MRNPISAGVLFLGSLCLLAASPATAQSLFLEDGQRAVEAVAGWSIGPSSDGLETRVGAGLGRVDVGIGLNRYTTDFEDGTSSTFSEVAPYVRFFVAKEQDGAPLAVALGAQYFVSNFAGDDSGAYVMAGPTIYKSFEVSSAVAVHPFLGFSLVAESYTFGGQTERAGYLSRNLGLVTTIRLDAGETTLLRLDVEEQSFRRETYRAARIGIIRRF
jgi:hypothetical protein